MKASIFRDTHTHVNINGNNYRTLLFADLKVNATLRSSA